MWEILLVETKHCSNNKYNTYKILMTVLAAKCHNLEPTIGALVKNMWKSSLGLMKVFETLRWRIS